jgi:hypothetical protein
MIVWLFCHGIRPLNDEHIRCLLRSLSFKSQDVVVDEAVDYEGRDAVAAEYRFARHHKYFKQ